MFLQRPGWSARVRTLIAVGLIALLYFLIPVEPGESGARLVWRSAATVLGVLIVAWLVFGQVRRQISAGPESDASPVQLAVALVAGIFIFALADYVIAVSSPGQFTGLGTKIDGLYFALTTVTTIGYGDVHAHGQFARTAVCLQMLYSIGVLASGASLLLNRLANRSGGEPPPRPGARPPDHG